MSSDKELPGYVKPREVPDYTIPIARTGEQQFACIMRNRSGESAGCIDFGVRDVTILCDAEQQDVVDTAFAVYEVVCDQTKKTAANDRLLAEYDAVVAERDRLRAENEKLATLLVRWIDTNTK
jgi:hypothetical protein